MSPSSLDDLQLHDEALPDLAFDDMPEFGGWQQPPQPGVGFQFQLPDMASSIYEPYESAKGPRIRVIFDRNHPLVILASPGGKANGETFQTQISSEERPRGKDRSVEVSDLDYLLKACYPEMTRRPASGQAFKDALKGLSHKTFHADLTWSWNCNPARAIYKKDGDGNTAKQDGVMGCGRKYYQADQTSKPEQKIQRNGGGEYPYELTCTGVAGNPCGAAVRAFCNLQNVRA